MSISIEKYLAWGESRLGGSLPTSYQYTGQRVEIAMGILFYRSRWYDPALGRCLQPDTLVPDPYNVLDWDRYAYVRSNPSRYTDPTGHFSEDELEEWFGKGWRKSFNDGWQALLLKAEFGDAVAYGKITAVFAQQDGLLIGWDVNGKTALTLDQMTSGSGELALYRSQNANQSGGPTKNDGIFVFGEATDPVADEIYGSNIYARIMGDPEHTSSSLTLPKGWYSGNNTHVDVSNYFAGFDVGLSDIFGGGVTMYAAYKVVKEFGKFSRKVALEGLGGWAGVAALTVDVASWTTWDTSYTFMSGQGPMPIYPVPTPRNQ